MQTEDVRDLTRPLWQLAENAAAQDGYGRPPVVRFVWGKAWNLPGVVAAVAERLEHFTQGGSPRRSWLRMRFLRVAEPDAPAGTATDATALAPPAGIASELESAGGPLAHEVLGAGPEGSEPESPAPGQRLDELAHRYFGERVAVAPDRLVQRSPGSAPRRGRLRAAHPAPGSPPVKALSGLPELSISLDGAPLRPEDQRRSPPCACASSSPCRRCASSTSRICASSSPGAVSSRAPG